MHVKLRKIRNANIGLGGGGRRLGLDRTIFIRKESDSNTRIETFRANPVVSSFQAPPGWAWGSPRGALGGYRTDKIQHFEGSASQSHRGNTSLRGGRAATGPRKHVTPRGAGRNRDEKTRHFEVSGSQSDREITSSRRVRVAVGSRKHVTSRGPGRNRTEKTHHFEGPGSQSDR